MKTWVWQKEAYKRWPCKDRGPLLSLLFVFEMLRYCAFSLSRHENNRKLLFEFFYSGKWGGRSCHSQLFMAKCHRLKWIYIWRLQAVLDNRSATSPCCAWLSMPSQRGFDRKNWNDKLETKLFVNQDTEPFTSGKYQFTGKGVMIIWYAGNTAAYCRPKFWIEFRLWTSLLKDWRKTREHIVCDFFAEKYLVFFFAICWSTFLFRVGFRHIVVFLPVSVVTAGPNYSWQGKFLANSSSGYFRKNRKVSVFNWTV